MLDNLLISITRLASRRLNRPALVFCFTAEPDGSFTTRYDVSKGVNRAHVEGAAQDLLRALSDEIEPDTACPCCLARRLRVATALAALTGDDGESRRVTH